MALESGSGSGSITSVLQETRTFPPPPEFAKAAHISSLDEYQALWNQAKNDPEGFWSEQALLLSWFKPWDKVLEWNAPFARWFLGGKLNASYNCVDRHCQGPDKNKAALIWEGEPGERRVLRYQDLLREVSRFANVLKSLGIKKGDVVAIYMPMIPELVIAALACARLGAPHTVVFGGFSAEALAGTDPGLQGQAAGHGRRRLPARQDRPAQGKCRRRRGHVPDARACGRLSAHGPGSSMDSRPRSLVA